MVDGTIEQLTLEYTARAWRQDAELAMGSDPVKAIVELVTNADDAYQFQKKGTHRERILIRVVRRRGATNHTLISVRDRAGGMTRQELVANLARVGGTTSGFVDGADVRGLLGRGAQDVAHFGRTTLVSTKAGKRPRFSIDPSDGERPLVQIEELPLAKDEGDGTVVTIEVAKRFSVPQHEQLRRYLERHHAFRPILRDRERRQVLLQDGDNKAQKLTYQEPRGQLLVKGEIAIPGFSNARAHVELRKASKILDDDMGATYWHHSLLIMSGRASYEIFRAGLFQQQPYSRYLARLFGTIEVPAINQLITEYEKRAASRESHDSRNPVNLVSRDRDGLVKRTDHPFVDALYSSIERFLRPYADQIREEEEAETPPELTEESKRRFSKATKVLSDYLQASGQGSPGPLPPFGVSIIPSTKLAKPGRGTSLTVRYRPREPMIDDPLDGVVDESHTQAGSQRRAAALLHGTELGFYSATINIAGNPADTSSAITVTVNEEQGNATVRWQEEEPDLVDSLQFEHARYSVQEGRTRHINLLAPADLIQEHDAPPEIRLQGDSSITLPSQPGIFKTDPSGMQLVCVISIKGAGIGSKSRITATAGGQTAEARVEVISVGTSGLEIEPRETDSLDRAWVEPDHGKLVLNASHPTLKRVLGPKSQNWPGQSKPEYWVMVAELIATAAALYRLQNKYLNQQKAVPDLLSELTTEINKLVDSLHRAMGNS